MAGKRKDSLGNILEKGESERNERGRRGYVYKWYDKETGKQCTIGAVTLEELREREKPIKKDIIDGLSTAKQKNTVNDFYRTWLKIKKRQIRDNVYSNYQYMYEKFVMKTLGKKQVSKVHKSDILNFYGGLIDDGMSVSTLDTLHNIIRQVFQVAFEDEVIRKNPCDCAMTGFKRTAVRKQPRALTDEEEQVFMDAIKGTQWECIFGVMLRTGMRVAEISALKWSDIDEKAGVIHVQRNFVYYREHGEKRYKGDNLMTRRIQETKTQSGNRPIPLSKEIEDWLDMYKEIGNKNTDEIDGHKGFIFATRDGMCYNQNALNRALKRIVAQVNGSDSDVTLPDMHCHMLRKTYVTSLIKSGVDLPTVARLAGHSIRGLDVTASVYTDVQGSMITDAGKKMQEYLDKRNG